MYMYSAKPIQFQNVINYRITSTYDIIVTLAQSKATNIQI